MKRLAAPALLALLCATPAGAQTSPPVTGPGQAIEGDLVSVNGQEFRLYGIDAPDKGQTCVNVKGTSYDCFALSTEMLRRLINDRTITCTPQDKAAGKGAKTALCRAENGDDLAFAMVERGYALAYRALTPEYVTIEARASSFRLGLWAGRVEAPWLWRSRMEEEKLDAMRKSRKSSPSQPKQP